MNSKEQEQKVITKLSTTNVKDEIKLATKWKIFPFVINSGAIGLSETGYKPINSKVTDFGKYELVITGNAPVVVIWKNSTKIYQKNKGTIDSKTKKVTGQDQFYTKKYKVGDYWVAALIEDISGVDFSTLVSNSIYKTITTKRSYKLVLTTEKLTVNDYLQFFVVFNDNNQNIGGDHDQDRQLLYLSEVVNAYDKDSGQFIAQTLTLSSLNDKLQASGQTTLGFIQYASPGSGYAFPVINDGKVTLNRDLMRDIGVTFAHRQSYGMELLSSCYYYGRPIIQGQKPKQINNEEIFESKVFASRRLFIAGNNQFSNNDVKNNGGLFAGLNDQITTNSHPETTFYNIMDASPTGYQNFKDWKAWLSSTIGILPGVAVKKDFKGVLKFDISKAIASNNGTIAKAQLFWDSLWNINNISGLYNVEMSCYFKIKNRLNQTLIGSPTFDYAKINQKYMSAILNFNGTIFSHLLQMPYDSEQWIPFAFSNIPIVGKYLNQLNLGIPFAFVLSQDSKQYQKMSYFNGFMSAFFTNGLTDIFGKTGLIPLNLFSNNSENEIGKLLGANISTTALLMKLTDRISIYPWTLDGKKMTTSEQISTVDLSQIRNDKAYVIAEDTQFLDIASPLTNEDTNCQWNPTADGTAAGEKYAYIIDYIVSQSLHQGEERHTFYSDNPIANNVNDFNQLSVAQYRFNNSAFFTGNMFNWTTQYKTNHDEYVETEETTFSYPAAILPPDPLNIAKTIIINTDLKIEMTANNLPLTDTNHYPVIPNTENWKNNNQNKMVNLNINLKDYLDSTLLINNFNDLKRFYKSITIYYSYDIETKKEINNLSIRGIGKNWYTDFNITENFNNPKNYNNGVKEILLKDLYLNSNRPDNDIMFSYWKENENKNNLVNLEKETGIASTYGSYGREFRYVLNKYKFSIRDNGNVYGWNQDFEDDSIINYCFFDNKNLNWTLYLQATLSIWYLDNNNFAYARIYISNIKAKIYKIVLNSR